MFHINDEIINSDVYKDQTVENWTDGPFICGFRKVFKIFSLGFPSQNVVWRFTAPLWGASWRFCQFMFIKLCHIYSYWHLSIKVFGWNCMSSLHWHKIKWERNTIEIARNFPNLQIFHLSSRWNTGRSWAVLLNIFKCLDKFRFVLVSFLRSDAFMWWMMEFLISNHGSKLTVVYRLQEKYKIRSLSINDI